MHFVQIQQLTLMGQHPIPVTVIQTAAGIYEMIGQTMMVLEWDRHPVPVTVIQTVAGFDIPSK